MNDDTNASRMFEQAQALHQQGQLEAARQIYQAILEMQPTHFDSLNLLGVLSGQLNQLQQAVAYFDRAIAILPDSHAAFCNRGLALKGLGQLYAARESFDRAIVLKDDDSVSYFCRGEILKELGVARQALENYEKCLELNPRFAQAHFSTATLLQQARDFHAALHAYDKAIEIRGDFVEAYINRGFILHVLQDMDAAIASYQRAVSISPNHVAYLYLGNALKDSNRREEALRSYELAIQIKPDYAEAHANLGVVLHDMGRIGEALASYDQALALNPNYAEAYFNRGSLYRATSQFEAAVADYERAVNLRPDIKFLPGALLESKLQICDWRGIEPAIEQITSAIDRDEPATHPFALLTFCGDLRLQRKAAEIFVREVYPQDDSLAAITRRSRSRKIHIGYFSADFREHPVSRLLAELIEMHNRDKFNVTAFSFGADSPDPMRVRLQEAFDRFIDVRTQSDREIALLARDMKVDIAVDLGGYTANSRTKVFALRAAPIQINYLGFPGTMGSNYMDYLVADNTLVSPEDQTHYSEKIIYLPSFQANDSRRRISDRVFTRDELGLPERGFVYCCFNTSYKIMPTMFGSWARILKRVPGSVLFLDARTETTATNLRREASSRGIAPERLVFGSPLSFADWMARHRVADLFLDTLPYNAGTTASDALWAGLPVLTRMSSSFAGRMAASLLRSIELPELVASTAEEYENLAVECAQRPGFLADVKRRLEENRLTKPLFNQRLNTHHLESAYVEIYERYVTGLPAGHVRTI